MEETSIHQLLTGIAHDARTPLAILQMLLIPISKKIPELQFDLLKKAVEDLYEIISKVEKYVAK